LLNRGTTYIELRAKLDQFERDLRAAESGADTSGKKIEGRFDSIGSKAGGIADKTKLMSVGIVAGLYGASEAASDLNETVSFTEVTFKSATDEMLRWGDQSLESLGIAKASALDAANQFGGLFQITGATAEESAKLSQQMVQLAVDMSSAKNVSLDEAVLALGSGLRGEAEPLRRFNVLLSDAAMQSYAVKNGISEGNQELTEAEKVQARLGIIMEQTTDIQGDYARTADSAANQQRRAKEAAREAAAELGQNLAPITAKVAGIVGDAVTAFSALPDPVQTGVVAILGMLAVVSPLAKGVEGLARLWGWYAAQQAAATASTVAGTAATSAATTGVRLLGTAMRALPWVALIIGSKEAADAIAENFSDAAVTVDEALRGSVTDTYTWLKQQGVGLFDEPTESAKELEGATDDLNKTISVSPTLIKTVRDGWVSWATPADRAAEKAENLEDKVRGLTMTKAEFRDWRDSTQDSLRDISGAFGELADDANITADELIDAQVKQINAVRDFRDNIETLIKRGAKPDFIQSLIEMGSEGALWAEGLAEDTRKTTRRFLEMQEESDQALERLTGTVNQTRERVGGDLDRIGEKADRMGERVKNNAEDFVGWERRSTRSVNHVIDRLEELQKLLNSGLAAPGTIRAEFPHGSPSAAGQFGTPTAWANAAMSLVPGFQMITSGYRPDDTGSYHSTPPPDNAVDIGGENLPGMFAVLAHMVAGEAREIIFGHTIIEKGRFGYYAPNDHGDHVHLADFGARVRGPALVQIGHITEDVHFVPRTGPGAVAPLAQRSGNVYNLKVQATGYDSEQIARETLAALRHAELLAGIV
jgi:hypothetical protein